MRMETQMPTIEWRCPKCGLVIRVKHEKTLSIDQALHLKKHEIDGY